MRKFSDFEKKLITKLNQVNIPNSNLLDFLNSSILENRALLFNSHVNSLIYIYELDDQSALNELFEFIGLIQFLKNNHLIFTHKNNLIPLTNGFISSNLTSNIYNTNTANYHTNQIQTDIYNLVQEYKQTFFISGTELKELESFDFKTQEELQFKKELCIAKISLLLAFIALIFSFIAPFIFDTTIDQSQINDIKNAIIKSK